MISFKQYITEIGDTEAGRKKLAIYLGTRTRQAGISNKRSTERLARARELADRGDLKRAGYLANILSGEIRKNTIMATGVSRAAKILKRYPDAEENLTKAARIAFGEQR